MKQLDDAEVVWTGGLVRARAYQADGTRPTLAIWIGAIGTVVGMALAPEDDAPATLRSLLAESLVAARAAGRAPARLRVSGAEALDAVSGLRGLPPVILGDNPFLRVVAGDRMCEMPELTRPETYFEPGLARTDIEEVARATVEFAESAPIEEGQPRVFQVDAPGLGLHNTCLWVGNEPTVSRGFLAFPSAVHYENAMRVQVRFTHVWDGEDQSLLELGIGTPAREPERLRELRRMGFRRRDTPVLPIINAFDADGVRRPTRPHDLERSIGIARALADAIPQLVDVGEHGSPASVRVTVNVGKTTHAVDVTYPHPEVGPALVELSRCPTLEELAA